MEDQKDKLSLEETILLADKVTNWKEGEDNIVHCILDVPIQVLSTMIFGNPEAYVGSFQNFEIECCENNYFDFHKWYSISCKCENVNVASYHGKKVKECYEHIKSKVGQEQAQKVEKSIAEVRKSLE